METPHLFLMSNNNNTKPQEEDRIFKGMKKFFDTDHNGWEYTQLGNKPVLTMPFYGANATWQCYAQAREKQEQFIFYSICGVAVSTPELMVKASELVNRINYGLVIGNFELDFSDGEVRFKTSIDLEGTEETYNAIKMCTLGNVITMDRYYGGFLAVLYANKEPEDVVQQIES